MTRLFIALCLSLAFTVTANAAPTYRATLTAAKNLRKSERKLAKNVASLSSTDREKLKRALARVGEDSDTDGVSDIYEKARGSDLCQGDSDNDGIDDKHDDYEENRNKVGDAQAKGTVTSFEDPTLVVDGITFTVTGSTRFRKGLTKDGLTPGVCIQVEGYVDASNENIATKIEGDDGCGDGGGGNGGDDGGNDN